MRSSLSNYTGTRLIRRYKWPRTRAGINGVPLPAEPWKPWSSPLVWARLAVVLLVLIATDAAVFALIWWLVAAILRHI
jgi:hypothetical protein